VDGLYGRVETTSEENKGTTFSLIIPLTLTSSRGLLVCISGELFVIPHNAIERILSIHPQDIFSFEGQDSIYFDEQPISLVRLSDILEMPRNEAPNHEEGIPVVIVSAADRRMAFVVDETTGEQEVVIKGLGKQLVRVGGITGATVLGNGQVVLILNVSDLLKMAMRSKRSSILDMLTKIETSTSARTQKSVLIVDDSITTRTLEKNILEAAGYAIQVATDGREAVDLIAASGVPDLIVSDIAMPRMNGFELTQRIKGDAKTAEVPIILVTSLDSPEDKTRGIEVGADAYIIKSKFDQNNLLDTIEQLI
jgi:two-component system chemotaxis sensor kinase CheA